MAPMKARTALRREALSLMYLIWQVMTISVFLFSSALNKVQAKNKTELSKIYSRYT